MRNSKTAGPKRLKVSRSVRALGYLFGAVLLVYLAAVAVWSSAWFQHALLDRTRAELNKITGARVEIGSMAIEPWIFEITFRGLVLHGSETGAELPLFAARELVIRLSPRAALHKRLELRRAALVGAEIHLYTRPDGSTNIPGPAAKAEGLAALDDLIDLAVGQIVVAQSDLYWDDSQFPLDFSAKNLAITLGFRQRGPEARSQPGYAGMVSASPLSLSNPEIGLPPVTFSTRFSLSKNALDIEPLVWQSSVMTGDGQLFLHWFPALESEFSFKAEGEAGPLARILRHHEVQGGAFRASSEGAYRSGAVDARGRVEASRLVILIPRLRPVPLEFAADYAVKGKQFTLRRIAASLAGGGATGEAQGQVQDWFGGNAPSLVAQLELQHFDPAAILNSVQGGPAVLADFPLTGILGGKVQISAGAKTGLRSRFDLRVQPSLPGREPISGFARGVATIVADLSANIDEAEIATPYSTLRLHGEITPSAANLAIQLKSTDFEDWRKAAEALAETPLPVTLDSPATFSGTVSGALNRLAVEGNFAVGAFEYDGSKWTGFESHVAVSPAELRISRGRLLGTHSAFALDLKAGLENWKFAPGEPLSIEAGADQTSVQGLREVLGIPYPLDGAITGRLELQRSGAGLAGKGAFHLARGSYDGEPFDSLDASFSGAAGTWKIARFELVKGSGHMTASGAGNIQARTMTAHARGQGFSLADFRRLQDLLGKAGSPGSKATGALDFDVEASGTLDNPAAHGSAAVRNLSAAGVTLGDLTSRVDWSGQQASAQGRLEGPGGALTFRGTARTEAGWPIELAASYSNLRLDPWLGAFGLASENGNVNVTGSANFSGDIRGPAPFKVESQVSKLEVSFAALKWQNDSPFEITLDHRRLRISPFELQGPSTHFRFEGTAGLVSPSSLNLTANGEIDSALLHVFSPAILTAGHFDVKLSLKGTLEQPSLFGTLHVDKVSVAYPGLPLRLTGLEGDIDLQGDHAVIRSLHAGSGAASAQITGSATVSRNPRYSLRAEIKRMRVDFPVQFTSVLDGSFRLEGTAGAAVISGNLTVAQMFVGENFNVLDWASALQNQPLPVPAATTLSYSPRVRLDVHLGSSPVVSIESRDLTAVATVDLTLRGTLSAPVAFGNVHIQSGQAVLRQSNYKITRGDITMVNPLRTEPVLDLEAKTRIQRYDLTLRVTGPADHPNISYRSDPPLSTPNILALLAFGYTREDQLIAGNGRSTFGTEGASALLSQALSSQVSNRITRLFGLSRISIDPNPSSLGGARLTVEEQLRRNFTITYVTTTGGTQERIIQIEWDLTDSISLLGIRDQNGVYGLELDFRRRFK